MSTDPSHVTISKRRACGVSYNDLICDGALAEKWNAAKRDGWRASPVLSDHAKTFLYRDHNGAHFYLTMAGLMSYMPA